MNNIYTYLYAIIIITLIASCEEEGLPHKNDLPSLLIKDSIILNYQGVMDILDQDRLKQLFLIYDYLQNNLLITNIRLQIDTIIKLDDPLLNLGRLSSACFLPNHQLFINAQNRSVIMDVNYQVTHSYQDSYFYLSIPHKAMYHPQNKHIYFKRASEPFLAGRLRDLSEPSLTASRFMAELSFKDSTVSYLLNYPESYALFSENAAMFDYHICYDHPNDRFIILFNALPYIYIYQSGNLVDKHKIEPATLVFSNKDVEKRSDFLREIKGYYYKLFYLKNQVYIITYNKDNLQDYDGYERLSRDEANELTISLFDTNLYIYDLATQNSVEYKLPYSASAITGIINKDTFIASGRGESEKGTLFYLLTTP